MKKIILAILVIFSSVSLRANDLWDHYRVTSSNAKYALQALEKSAPESLSVTSADQLVGYYKELEKISASLGREDLYVWSLNNAMYAKIVLFKKLVRYDEANKAINALNPQSKERIELVKQLKSEYVKYISVLEGVDADEIVRNTQSKASENQWSKIVSNRQFIVDTFVFVGK